MELTSLVRTACAATHGCNVQFSHDVRVCLPSFRILAAYLLPVNIRLSDATLMSMGKGFTITSNLDLGKQLRDGYSKARSRRKLPDVQIVAIVNDTVATLISFAHQVKASPQRKAAMGLIVGTGSNATIPLKLSSLNAGKRLKAETVANGDVNSLEEKILVNTEWSINGTAGPLRELNLITRWDKSLDDAGILPGFQPFEYMTAGRYLGELGRLIILDYLTTQLINPRRTTASQTS